jgi:hypothetical protein
MQNNDSESNESPLVASQSLLHKWLTQVQLNKVDEIARLSSSVTCIYNLGRS